MRSQQCIINHGRRYTNVNLDAYIIFFFQYMHYQEAFTYLCCPRFLSNSLLLLRQFVYPTYVLSICIIAMSLRIAQCTSSSQQSVTGSIFQRPHGKKAPQNGHHHRFGE